MKKLLIFLMALSLFTACNNDKGKFDKKADYREKDDYGNNDDQSNEKSRKDDDSNSDEKTSSDGWSERDISKFNVECMSGFPNNQDLGKKICPCALEKFQKKYKSYSEVETKSNEAEGNRIGAQCKDELNINTDNAITDNNDDPDNDNDKGNYTEKGWPAFEVRDYVTSCVREAVKSGMNKYDAQSYCECMQVKMEKKFPDIKVAGRLSQEEIVSISKKFAPGCLEEH